MYTVRASQLALVVKNQPANVGDERDVGSMPGSGRSPGGGNGNPLQYCSSILAWKIPRTEEPGGLQSMGSQIVGHVWATKRLSTHTHIQRPSGISRSALWSPQRRRSLCMTPMMFFPVRVCVKLLSHVWLFVTLWTVARQAPLSMENSPGQNKSVSGPYSSVSPYSVTVSVRLVTRGQRIWLQCRRPQFEPWVGKIPWRRERLPTPVFWPGEFHGLHSLWGCKDQTRMSDFHFHYYSVLCNSPGNLSNRRQKER